MSKPTHFDHGNRVRIISFEQVKRMTHRDGNLFFTDNPNDICFNIEMSKYCGSVHTIDCSRLSNKGDIKYSFIDWNGDGWTFSHWMLEPAFEETCGFDASIFS